jgi:hypothetical protein
MVRLAASRCGIKDFKDYIILGDDIAIAHKLVAMEYIKIVKSIGIEISMPKSITPQIRGYNSWEFASKLMINGINISPLPLGQLLVGDFQRTLRFFRSLLESMSLHAVDSPFDRLLEVIAPSQDDPELSGLFIVKSLNTENFKGLTLYNFLTIFGIFLGINYLRSNYTKESRTGLYTYSRQYDVNHTSPSLYRDTDQFLNGVGLRY